MHWAVKKGRSRLRGLSRGQKTGTDPVFSVFFVVAFVLPVAMLAGCGEAPATVVTADAMGSRLHITLPAGTGDRAVLEADLAALLDRIERDASHWREQSWVSRFNRDAQAGVPMPVPPHVSAMLREARSVHGRSGGVLDVTAGPLVELWGFGAQPNATEPSEMQMAEALARCGFDKLALNDEASVVVKRVPGVRLDLSALGKGYAVDRVAAMLDERGVSDYLIAFGGEVRAKGDGPGGDDWVVQVGDKQGRTLTLRNQSVATSGGVERQRATGGGGHATHLIDPRTGRPMDQPGRSVTVVAEACMTADAWATALAIDPGLALPEGVEVAGGE